MLALIIKSACLSALIMFDVSHAPPVEHILYKVTQWYYVAIIYRRSNTRLAELFAIENALSNGYLSKKMPQEMIITLEMQCIEVFQRLWYCNT